MDKATYERGMAMRRRVLGDDYVDRAVAGTTDFDRQFQAQVTEHAWGAVWGDDALSPPRPQHPQYGHDRLPRSHA